MSKTWHNNPTVQYCIEVYLPGSKEPIDRFTIEQVEAGRVSKQGDHGNYNTVQRHLNDLSQRKGLDYKIVRWGDPKPRQRWMSGGRLDD